MRKLLNYKFVSGILLILVVWIGFSTRDIWDQREQTNWQVGDLEKRKEYLEAEAKRLEESKEYLSSNDYLEKQARLQLNYKDIDEKVVFVYRNKTASASPEPEKRASIFQVIKSWTEKIF